LPLFINLLAERRGDLEEGEREKTYFYYIQSSTGKKGRGAIRGEETQKKPFSLCLSAMNGEKARIMFHILEKKKKERKGERNCRKGKRKVTFSLNPDTHTPRAKKKVVLLFRGRKGEKGGTVLGKKKQRGARS